MRSPYRLLPALLLLALVSANVRAETAYFVLSGTNASAGPNVSAFQSYVVSTSDPALIQQARDYLANPPASTQLIASARLVAGSDGINLNYSAPGHPAWPWHVDTLVNWSVQTGARSNLVGPGISDGPSNAADLLAGKGGITTPVDNPPTPLASYTVNWRDFYLTAEIAPGKSSAVANVSARGPVGTGDGMLIVGFIVQGSEPRNLVLRALGPSLTAAGVSGVIADPKLAVYRGSTKLAENDNWADGTFTPTLLPDQTWLTWLYPTNAREAALYLTLPPGAYTMIVSGANNATGIALADVHDVDALKPQ